MMKNMVKISINSISQESLLQAGKEFGGYARASLLEGKHYLRRIRKYVFFSLMLFSAFILSGYAYGQAHTDEATRMIAAINDRISTVVGSTSFETFLGIFQNNLDIDLAVVGLGFYAGIMPFVTLAINGFALGLYAFYYFSKGLGLVFLLGILPHGIIEVPCLIFSAAAGLKIAKTALFRLFNRKEDMIHEVASGLKFAVTFILPLTLLAAFIENYITPFFIMLALLFSKA